MLHLEEKIRLARRAERKYNKHFMFLLSKSVVDHYEILYK